MYSNIVKIKQDKLKNFGTGLIISGNTVLTSEHVVSSEDNVIVVYQNISFEGKVNLRDDFIALISIDDFEFTQMFTAQSLKLMLTNQEIFTPNQKWEIQGYRSNDLIEHSINGLGLYPISSAKISCDYEVGNIRVGMLQDYSGLSGSPIICNERAVGIVQIQFMDPSGKLGIGFTSIEKFMTNIPSDSLAQSKYISELVRDGYKQSISEVNKNKKSAKYIPDIFVEEDEYKENLRFFCDPILFFKKSIADLQALDFSNVNEYLHEKKIYFSDHNNNEISPENFQVLYEELRDKIRSCVNLLEKESNNVKRAGANSLENEYKHISAFNNSLKWDLEKIYEQINFIEKRVILITKNAGQGKTNFLCDFTENFLAKKNIPSFYFNASSFIEKPSIQILNKITLEEIWSKEYVRIGLRKFWETTGKFVVIVIDGLNENTTLNRFNIHIEESIKELLNYPYIKIIMSTRNEMFEDRFGNLSCKTFGNQFQHLNMKWYQKDKFKKRILEGYLKFFDVSVSWNKFNERVYDQLSEDTLLLRFFCEVNKGKRQVYMYDIYKYSLFTQYYDLKRKEMIERGVSKGDILFDRLLNHIAEYMISNEIFTQIPISTLNTDEIHLLNNLLEADVIFKKDTLMEKGFIKEISETVSFTFDEFRDYCLTKYLVSKEDAIESFPIIWKKMHDNKWIIIEGVEKYVFFLSRTITEIKTIIKKDANYPRIYWNNVWNLEESDFCNEDLELWRKHFLSGGDYINEITSFLIYRRDRNYFKKTSIDVLFGLFIELSKTPWKFDEIIHMLFPLRKLDKYNHEIPQQNSVFYCDQFIKSIKDKLSKTDIGNPSDYQDALRLSMFIYHMMPKEINELWKKAYSIIPKHVIEILENYSNIDSESIFLRQNYRDIVNILTKDTGNQRLSRFKNIVTNDNDYKMISDILRSIWM